MPEKAPFLTRPYSAYHHREVPADDTELTRVGPGTPCGEYMRRFWHPVAFSDELEDLPKAIRILGEDLVIFRDVEPANSSLKDRLCHGAYPTREHEGLVFAYLGPPERIPALPMLDTFDLPGYRCLPGRKHIIPCNWLQIKDNSMDPAHSFFLHTIVSGAQFTGEFGIVPEVEFMETSCGMAYVATRRVGERVWVRTSDFIPPNVHQFPPTWEKATEEKVFGRPYMTIWAVPLDDTHTMNTGYLHIPNDMEVDERRLHALKESVGQTGAGSYEERQRRPGDFEAQVSQRPIAVHALEHLVAADRGVIMLRKLVRDGIRATASGKDPQGVTRVEGRVIRTYAQDTVVHLPPGATPEAERQQLLDVGRKVMDDFYVKNPPASISREALRASGVT